MNYDTRQSLQFQELKVYSGSESITYLWSKIWYMVLDELKEMSSISSFKKAIKKWYPRNCWLCKRLSRNYWFYLNYELIRRRIQILARRLVRAFCWLFLREAPSWMSRWVSDYTHVIYIYLQFIINKL